MKRTILVPIDINEESSWNTALPEAFKMAKALDGDIVVMTVVPEVLSGVDWRYAIRGETGTIELNTQAMVDDAVEQLKAIASKFAPPDMSFDVMARYGTIYEEILNYADEIKADQIIMAAHKPSVADFLLGQNAARVARHAKCSVNIVRLAQ